MRIESNLKATVNICCHVLVLSVAGFTGFSISCRDKSYSTTGREIIYALSSENLFQGHIEVGLSPVLFVTEV
jgi:hypothetical protein